jgi:3-mercaptopyruvate sulfurtransferase SseA
MARLLLDHIYKDVRPLLGGFDAWVELGYPVEPHRAAAAQAVTVSGSGPSG